MDFLVVTGMSGAGKTSAMHFLEDIGFYCVDNIPPQLVGVFYDLCKKSEDKLNKKVAVVTDIRSDTISNNLSEPFEKLNSNNSEYKVLFLDSSDQALIKRFRETRRRHPLLMNYRGSILKAIEFERKVLKPIKNHADYVIDTSILSLAQLKERISDLFLNKSQSTLIINCLSFGFKYGVPLESDLVFDVRCLPNPFYVESLKEHTGLEDEVSEYVLKWNKTKGFVERMFSLVDYMIPLYCSEGKSQLVISIGCMGGKHRSVAIAQLLCEHLKEKKFNVCANHRDINKETSKK